MVNYDPEHDAYATLGVRPDATQEEIDHAFRKAALMWHPDKSPAPDAAEHFAEVQVAAGILRNARKRKRYDRLRELHLGPAAKAQARARTRARAARDPQPYVPMTPPPEWLAPRVRIHYDAVLLTLALPQVNRRISRVANALALVCLGAGMTTGRVMLGALSLVLFAIGWLLRTPPHKGRMAWAKIVPGRQEAEYHMLDPSAHRYDRLAVPFHMLRIAVVAHGELYRLEIQGFPRAAVPVLHETHDVAEARRCAREAGRWLKMQLEEAA